MRARPGNFGKSGLEVHLRQLFPVPVSIAVAAPAMYDLPLLPGENQIISMAGRNRQREFAAGRASARQALSAWGQQPVPLLRTASGAPHWPAGFVGSISHSGNMCVAVAAPSQLALAIGIDVEQASPLRRELNQLIFNNEELAHLENLSATAPAPLLTKIGFTAKEAFYKAYNTIVDGYIDFLDIEVSINALHSGSSGSLHIIPLKFSHKGALTCNWKLLEDYIFTACTII